MGLAGLNWNSAVLPKSVQKTIKTFKTDNTENKQNCIKKLCILKITKTKKNTKTRDGAASTDVGFSDSILNFTIPPLPRARTFQRSGARGTRAPCAWLQIGHFTVRFHSTVLAPKLLLLPPLLLPPGLTSQMAALGRTHAITGRALSPSP